MNKPSSKNKAQTAVELAVFGAIIIFVLGAVIRQSMGFGMQQNQSLKAMRLAMSLSFRYSEGLMNGLPSDGTTSRNSATVLFIEDRLGATADKFGAVDRVPTIIGGRGAFSNQFFQPLDAGENFNLPVQDIFINGKHIPLMISAFRTLGGNNPAAPGYIPLDNTHPQWEPNCLGVIPADGITCAGGGLCSYACLNSTPGCAINCDATLGFCECQFDCDIPPTPPSIQGCVTFYAKVINNPQSEDWCAVDGPGLGECDVSKNLSSDERFDLDRDFVSGPVDPDVPVADRPTFAWQWKKVYAVNAHKMPASSSFIQGEGINPSKGENMYIDVDGDLKEEHIISVVDSNGVGVITKMIVTDEQNGDIDLGYDTADYQKYLDNPLAPDVKPRPGLKEDTSILTFVKDDTSPNGGTYMIINEGKLFQPSGDTTQYMRNVQKKDSVDFIQRIIQLSNDTDRFCNSSGAPAVNPSGMMLDDPNIKNPVEACNSCFSTTNIEKTCFDEATLQLFVRSRVKDLHGRKWITPMNQDPYVDFDVPPPAP